MLKIFFGNENLNCLKCEPATSHWLAAAIPARSHLLRKFSSEPSPVPPAGRHSVSYSECGSGILNGRSGPAGCNIEALEAWAPEPTYDFNK
jgi:hypothetical protein